MFSHLAVHFVDLLHGWATGQAGKVLETHDGGSTWTLQTSGTTNDLYKIRFASTTHGWAVGTSGTILGTVDGGTIWTTQDSGTRFDLHDLSALTTLSLRVAGGAFGIVLGTETGGY